MPQCRFGPAVSGRLVCVDQLRGGSVVGGRYRLTGPVQAVRPGTVWRAIDQATGDEVAVKTLGAFPADDQRSWARAKLALRVIAGLQYPGIARVYDYGQVTTQAGIAVPYLVREVVAGTTLEQRLGDGPLPVTEALRVVAAVADALTAVHQAGLVHGNLVPANVVFGADGVRVTDVGLWVLRDRPAEKVFPSALSYAAPERAAGAPATPATDMYSLGVVFVACLTGITAGGGAGAPPLPELSGDSVAAGLASLWAACLGASPWDRPSAAHAAVISRQLIAASTHTQPSGQPAPAHLDTAHLDTAHLDRAHLDRAQPDAAHLHTASLDTASLEGARPDTAHLDTPPPGPLQPGPARPDAPRPGVPRPDALPTGAPTGPPWPGEPRPGALPTGAPAAHPQPGEPRPEPTGARRPRAPRTALPTGRRTGGPAGRGDRRSAPAGTGPAGRAHSRRRRGSVLALGGAAAGVMVAVVLVLAQFLTSSPQPATGSAAGSPGVAAVSPPAVSSPATPHPGASAEATSSVPTARTPKTTPLAAINQLWRSVQHGAADRQIRSDVALDFENLIGPVRDELIAGEPAQVESLVPALRHKLAERLGEGSITAGAAQMLGNELTRLAYSTRR